MNRISEYIWRVFSIFVAIAAVRVRSDSAALCFAFVAALAWVISDWTGDEQVDEELAKRDTAG